MDSRSFLLIATVLLALKCMSIGAFDNGLALKPPMGWISWARFTCNIDCRNYPADCISSRLYVENADKLVELGLDKVGYQYINIDDCWSTFKREPRTERLVPDPERFPLGMGKLAEEIHSKGLKFGIYGDCGTMTCAQYPAQLKDNVTGENYYQVDADTFNEWQVDSFKFDGCFIDEFLAEQICPKMSTTLLEMRRRGGRDILLTCEWPFYLNRAHGQPDYELVARSCNLWRYYEDIEDSWASIMGVLDFTISIQDQIVIYHGPGGWFDPDQLEIGNFALSYDQARAQMAIWSLWSAPLFMSNDLRKIDEQSVKLLSNQKLIDVDQDEWGVFGLMVARKKILYDHEALAFVKPIMPVIGKCPTFVVAYLNKATLGSALKVSFTLSELLAKASNATTVAAKRSNGKFDAQQCEQMLSNPTSGVKYQMHDLMDDMDDTRAKTIGLTDSLDLLVNPNGVRVVKLMQN